MKGKIEDKLAKLAFGELSPEEAAKLEREVQNDPEALRALSLYKDMRAGLKSLSDVPEDQFSKERLRDAILTQGLKPLPTRPISSRSWLWMPATACAMGFVLMFTLNLTHKKPLPQVVMGPEVASLGLSNSHPIEIPKNFSTGALIGPTAPPTTVATTTGDAKQPDDMDEVDPRVLTSMEPTDAAYDPDLGVQPPKGNTLTASRTSLVSSARTVSLKTSGSIVLIDQDKDEQTGACKATEVGSSSNVLVGG